MEQRSPISPGRPSSNVTRRSSFSIAPMVLSLVRMTFPALTPKNGWLRRLSCSLSMAADPCARGFYLSLCRWPNKLTFFAGLAVTAIVGWLVVWAFLYPDLRRLRRVADLHGDRAKSAEFIRQLASPDRANLRRRRRALVEYSLVCFSLIGVGIWMTLDGPWLGYDGSWLGYIVIASGFAGVKWLRLALLPPKAILEMPDIFGMWASNELEADPRSAEPRDRVSPSLPNSKALPLQSAVWDRELDGTL